MAESYEQLLKKGSAVEVSSEEEGLRGSWYSATVIRACSRRSKKILLEYHRLITGKIGSKPLREFSNAILVRPEPPREPPGSVRFKVDDDVDAFHNDGWWEGVVTEVIEDSRRYSVFFRCSREQIEFDESELRVHREWVNGDWVPPLEHRSPLPRSSRCRRKLENGEVSVKRGNNNKSSSGGKRTSSKAMSNSGSQKSKKQR